MAKRIIKAVLFDLGETIFNFGKLRTTRLFIEAGRISYEFLQQLGQPVGKRSWYILTHLVGLRFYHILSVINGRDFDSLVLLKKHGQKKGVRLTQEQWEELNWLWYEPLGRAAKIEPDISGTLTKLTEDGLVLGILSNTFIHRSVLDRHLDKFGILDFFRLRMYSYEFDFRKPDRRIFLAAAEKLGVTPANILFVGDRINVDIIGSVRAGMTAVLKNAYTNVGKNPPSGVVRIDYLSQLPELVAKINAGSRLFELQG